MLNDVLAQQATVDVFTDKPFRSLPIYVGEVTVLVTQAGVVQPRAVRKPDLVVGSIDEQLSVSKSKLGSFIIDHSELHVLASFPLLYDLPVLLTIEVYDSIGLVERDLEVDTKLNFGFGLYRALESWSAHLEPEPEGSCFSDKTFDFVFWISFSVDRLSEDIGGHGVVGIFSADE